MDNLFFNTHAILIQGITMDELESMMSRLLDKKLADIIGATPKVEESPKDGLLKRKDAARKLQVSLPTLDSWTKLGIINARRIGTRVYYTDKDINDALKKVSK